MVLIYVLGLVGRLNSLFTILIEFSVLEDNLVRLLFTNLIAF